MLWACVSQHCYLNLLTGSLQNQFLAVRSYFPFISIEQKIFMCQLTKLTTIQMANYSVILQCLKNLQSDNIKADLLIIFYQAYNMMKQQCWKQLKQQICSQDKWIKDKDQPKCQCCNKQFKTLVRRRHHCRFCGNIFCSNCSDFFINGTYLGLKQKYVRHCEFCHQKIQKFIKDCVKMPDIYDQNQPGSESDQDDYEEQISFLPEQQSFNLTQIFGEAQKKICSQMIYKLDEQIKNKVFQMSQLLCKKFGIDEKVWPSKLADIALKAAIQTKMDSLTSEGPYQSSMDIVKQVRYKTILTQPDKITAIILKGIVLQKNLPSKHMLSHLSKPKVLVVQNSIDIQSFTAIMKFQDLVKNQKSIMKKILEKVIKLQPDIVFIQGNISVQALDYFQSKSICVVNKIKKKDMESIMEVTSVKKTVRKLWMIQKYKPQNILGSCDKIYFKTIREGQTLMFVQAQVGVRTIILGETTEQMTNYLKRTSQILLRYARQMNLQKYLIAIDNQMHLVLPKNISFNFISQLNLAVYDNIQTFFSNQEVSFTKIVYSHVKYSVAPKQYIQYGQKFGKSNFYQICGKVQYEKKKLYANGDMTIGGYILLTIAMNQKNCKKCDYSHCQRYYFPKNLITIKHQKKLNQIDHKSSFVNLQFQANEEVFTLQRLKNMLKKQKEKLVIQIYNYCQVCHNIVGSQPIKVGKNYLQNSFYYFLSILSQTFDNQLKKDETYQRQRQKSLRQKARKLSIDKCDHGSISRVFQYCGSMIKLIVSQIKMFDIVDINLTNQEGQTNILNNQLKFVENVALDESKQMQLLCQQIVAMINRVPFNHNLNGSISLSMNQPKVYMYYQVYLQIKSIMDSIVLQVKSLKELQIDKKDWTSYLYQIYKLQALMKIIFDIIDYFQNFWKKKKFDDKLQPSGLQNQDIQKLSPTQEIDTEITSIIKQIPQHSFSMSSISLLMDKTQRVKRQNQVVDPNIINLLKKIRKERFPISHGIYLKYSIAFTFDPVSVLASSLNSKQFQKIKKQNQSEDKKEEIIKFKMQYATKMPKDHPLKGEVNLTYNQLFDQQTEKIQQYQITVYFHEEFQKLRLRQGINFETYVRSLCGCKSWDSSGGKSNSTFAKSHNQILVVKIINQKQFVQFQKFAKHYLSYIQQAKKQNKESLLAKIYGIYQISMRGKVHKCIVMQNIFFGMTGQLKVYDLKGSQVNRLNMPEGQKNITGQDTNFKIDKQGNPYIVPSKIYDQVTAILQNDANFLKSQEVIDYSLLAIEGRKDGLRVLRLGIIDFMRPYHIFQKIQSIYKKSKSGKDPTVIPPDQYAERFILAMRKYFIKVD